MNVAAHDRREERELARFLASNPVPPKSSRLVRSSAPLHQGITPTALRQKVHQLGPTASLVRRGRLHYICTIGRSQRFEGYVGEVYEQMKPLFLRFNIQ